MNDFSIASSWGKPEEETDTFSIGNSWREEEDRQKKIQQKIVERQVWDRDPKRAAEALSLANERGIPPSVMYRKLDEFKRPPQIDYDKMRREAPGLAGLMSSTSYLPILQADADNLSWVERNWGEFNKRVDSAFESSELGRLGYKWAQGTATEEEKQRVRELQRLQASRPDYDVAWYDPGYLLGIVGQAAVSTGGTAIRALDEAALGAGTGLVTGATIGGAGGTVVAPGFGTGVGVVGGGIVGALSGASTGLSVGIIKETYEEQYGLTFLNMVTALDENGDPIDEDTARFVATGVGAANAVLERVSFGVLTKSFPGVRDFLSKGTSKILLENPAVRSKLKRIGQIVEAGAAEGSTELAQSVIELESMLAAGAVLDEQGNPLKEQRAQYPTAFIEGAIGGSGLALGGQAVQATVQSVTERRRAKAEARQQTLIELGDKIRGSKVTTLSPEALAEHAKVMDENTPSQMTAPVEAVVKLFQEEGFTPEQIEQRFPGITASLNEAQSGNAEVKLSAADVVKMAQLKGYNEFTGDVRIGNTPTANEAKAGEAEFQQMIDTVPVDDQRQAVEASIQNEITQQLVAAGQENRAAQTQAKLFTSTLSNLAQRAGLDVNELYRRYNLSIGGEQEGQAVGGVKLEQDTPEFRNWFLDSKVVDETGAPQVMYRGSLDDIGETASRDGVIYFSKDPNVAAGGERGFITDEVAQAAGINPADIEQPSGLRVVPAYLSIQNPATLADVQRLAPNAKTVREAMPALKAAGFDGYISDYETAVFDPRQIKSVNNRGTFDPNNPNILMQSGVPLFENPLPIEGKATINKVGQALTDRHQDIYGRKLDPSTSAEDYNQVRDDMIEEINFQLQQRNSGVGWYSADVELAIRLLSVVFPSLRDNVAHRQLLLMYAAVFSSGNDPDKALQISTEAFETFLKTGETPVVRADAARARGVDPQMTTFKDKSGKEVTKEAGWTQRSETNEQQLAFIRYIIEREGSLEAGMNWLLNEQPREEINRAMTESGLYQGGRFKTRAEIAGPPERGVLAFGPKLGRYAMGLQGVEIDEGDVTIDLWYIRTYRRLIGGLLDGPLDPKTSIVGQPNDTDREVIRRLTGDLVAHFADRGYTVGDVQAVLWFYEKRLWAAHGLRLDEGTNSTGAKRFLEERGYYVGSKIGEAYDREGGTAAAGVLGGQEPERLIGRQRSARRFVSRRLGWSGDEGVRLYGRRGNSNDRKVRGIVNYYVPNTALVDDLTYSGYAVIPEIEELDPKRTPDFRKAISDARAASEFGAAVHVYKEEEYRNMRLFLTPDKKAGFAVKPDGDIVSVFSDGGGKTAALLSLAVEMGGTKLDAFNTVLPKIYAISGFKEVGRDAWNEEYKDPDWDYETFKAFNDGRPDIVYMVYDAAYDPYAEEVTNVRDDQTRTLFQGVEPERAGDGRGRYSAGSLAPLEGAPTVAGASGPDLNLVAVAEQYARDNGINLKRQGSYVEVDEDRARRIAAAYEAMEHAPQDPVVKEAYANLIVQTKAQYDALVAAGYSFTFYDDATDPYDGNPWNAMRDLRQNKRMAVYGTYAGFGTEGVTGAEINDNPMLVDTGLRWQDQTGAERVVTANDLFRAVHDAFGHGLEGAGFRARGEENAWQAHIRLYTGSAVAAVSTGTRGQNSWLNYGPYGESNKTAKVEDTVFARQKIGLLPSWVWEEGRAADEAPETGPQSLERLYQNAVDAIANADLITNTPEFRRWFGKSVVVDDNGKPLIVYHGSEKAGFTVFETDGGSAKTKGTGAFFSNKLSNAMTYSGKHTIVNFPTKEDALANPGRYGFTVEEGDDGKPYIIDADGYQTELNDGETVDQAMVRAVDDWLNSERLAGPEQANVPVFLRMEKPLIIDANGANWSSIGATPVFEILDAEGNVIGSAPEEDLWEYGEGATLGNQDGFLEDGQTTDQIVREARQSGEYDGVIIRNVVDEGQYGWYGDPSDVYVVFYKNQIKSVQNQGTFSNDDPNILKQKARGFITFSDRRDRFQITLTGKANFSTFVHESGHFFLEVMQDLVARGEAPQQIIDDLEKIRQWTGVEDGGKFETRHHEKFARGFEAYLREGRAPDSSLQDIFNRFRAWLVFIYKKMTALNVDLTDEVRGVFDRLVASDAAIAEARTQLGWSKPLAQEALALTDAEYARYVEAWQKASDEQSRELDERMMREAAEVRKDLWRQETERRVGEEIDALKKTRGYKAWKALSEGEGLEDLGRTALKIDPESVPPEWRRDTVGLTQEGGLPLEVVAELLGFNSGEAMLQLIGGAKFALRDIPIRVKKAMETEHGHLDAAALTDAANEAVIKPVGEVLLSEYRALASAAGIKAEPGLGQWLAATAKRKVQALTQRQLEPNRWRRAELKSAQEAAAAAARGDKQKAALAKRQQLMAAAMYRATIEAQKRIDTIQKKLTPFTKDKRRAQLGKAGDSYLDAIDEILEGISFKNVTAKSLQKQDRLAAFLKEAEEKDLPVNIPDYLTNALGKRNYSTMTLEELEGVHDTVMSIWHLAKTKNELRARKEKRDLEQAIAEMEVNAEKALGDPKIVDKFVYGWKDRASARMKWVRANLTKMEFLFGWLDGQPSGGLMHRYIYQPLTDANKAKFDILKRFNTTIIQHMRNLPAEQKARWNSKRRLLGREANGATIIAAALNLGNEGNKTKLLAGYSLDNPQGEARLMAEINAFMRKEDWDFVQHIWDEIDTLWPKVVETTKAATGLPPERVEAVPVVTPFGTYKGGYYPVVYDPSRSQRQFENQQKDKGLFSTNYLKPTLGDGFVKARTKYSAPILLDLRVISQHLSEVVHYVTHYEAVTQADKITRHPRFQQIVKQHMGDEFYNTIRPWLTDIARDQDTPAVTKTEPFAEAMQYLRGGMSIGAMGYNIFTGVKQLLGVTSTLDAVKTKYWISGLVKAWMSPNAVANWKEAFAKSKELEPLISQFDRDIKMVNDTYAKQGIRNTFDKFNALAFAHIGWLQATVNVASWHGAYEQALAEGATDEAAVDRADAVVRMTQSAGAVKDLSPIQRGTEINRNISMFYSWFNVLYNRLEDIARQTKGVRDLPRAAKRIGVLVMMSALIEESLSRAYEEIFDNVEDDEEEKGFILTVLMKSADTMLAAIPLARAFVSVEAAAGGLKPEISPVIRVPADFWRTFEAAKDLVFEQEAPSRSEVKTAVRTVSVLTHVPVSGLYNLFDEYFGEEIFDEKRKAR